MKKYPSPYGFEYIQDKSGLLDEKTQRAIDVLCNCRIELIRSTMWKCRDYWHVPWRKISNFFMIFVFSGKMQVEISEEKREMKRGDFFLCPPDQEHTFGLDPGHKKTEHMIVHFGISSTRFPAIDKLFSSCFFQLSSGQRHLMPKLKLLPALWMNKDTSMYEYAHCLLKGIFLDIAFTDQEGLCPLAPLDSRIGRAVAFINEKFLEDISVTDAADTAELSEAQFRKVFRKQMHCSPLKYLTTLRMRKACLLLLKDHCNISQVAFQSGFNNPNYFCRLFKSHYNCTPGEYRKNSR